MREELQKTQDLIGPATHELKFFRPPYGSTNAVVDKVLKSEGFTKVLWSVDPLDWHPKYKKSGAWVDLAMTQIKQREDNIVLMHDIHATTVDRVADLIGRIKQIPKADFASYA
jgi:peptidoglycan/xylan/chitin deacetylase (PgdA/CDA1 family)